MAALTLGVVAEISQKLYHSFIISRIYSTLLPQAQVIDALQVEPELGSFAEEVLQAQRGVTGDRALAMQNGGDAVGRHVQVSRQLSGAHAQSFELLCQMAAGMDQLNRHAFS